MGGPNEGTTFMMISWRQVMTPLIQCDQVVLVLVVELGEVL